MVLQKGTSKRIIEVALKEAEKRGYNISQICELMECSRVSFYHYKKGDMRISVDKADKMLKNLNLSYTIGVGNNE